MICGGVGCVAVLDRLNREVARIYFRRPNSEEILTYVYEQQNIVGDSESRLREIQQTKSDKQVNKIHEVLVRDFYLPWAEKIFVRCEGYVDSNGKSLDTAGDKAQFDALKKYHSHSLVDMTAFAFEREGSVKKKE